MASIQHNLYQIYKKQTKKKKKNPTPKPTNQMGFQSTWDVGIMHKALQICAICIVCRDDWEGSQCLRLEKKQDILSKGAFRVSCCDIWDGRVVGHWTSSPCPVPLCALPACSGRHPAAWMVIYSGLSQSRTESLFFHHYWLECVPLAFRSLNCEKNILFKVWGLKNG